MNEKHDLYLFVDDSELKIVVVITNFRTKITAICNNKDGVYLSLVYLSTRVLSLSLHRYVF